jgi:uncharacterized membrane protein
VLFVLIQNALLKQHKTIMNLKRTFGAILTVLGIIGLIYTGIGVINHSGQATTLVVVGIIAVLFFFTGISLVRTTKDEV